MMIATWLGPTPFPAAAFECSFMYIA